MATGRINKIVSSQVAQAKVSPGRIGDFVSKKAKSPEDKKWNFGFLCFREIENFGLNSHEVTKSWVGSLMQRLQDLSCLTINECMKSHAQANKLRLHPINWDQKNIPLQFSDLNWIPKEYSENREEYVMFQLQISKGRGRIIGFFDENWIFQIVLLDPLHNMQPSADYAYKVDHCTPIDSEYELLHKKISTIAESHNCTCDTAVKLTTCLTEVTPSLGSSIILCLHRDDINKDIIDTISICKGETNVIEIFKAGIDAIIAKN